MERIFGITDKERYLKLKEEYGTCNHIILPEVYLLKEVRKLYPVIPPLIIKAEVLRDKLMKFGYEYHQSSGTVVIAPVYAIKVVSDSIKVIEKPRLWRMNGD